MRPHRLRLTAFGPFAGEVTVDFDRMTAGGLFLLQGDTGSGKTSILDGLAFAMAAHSAGGVTLVEYIASLPAARGRGAGAAVTWAATLADPDRPAVLIASDGYTNDDTPVLRGTAEAGATVNIYEGDTLLGTATVNQNGVWRFETGTLTDGSIAAGDPVVVEPGGRAARVRVVQTTGTVVGAIEPGHRVALNLSGVEHTELARGDVVVAPGRWRTTARVDASLTDADLVGAGLDIGVRTVWRFEITRRADERREVMVDDRTGAVLMNVDLVAHADRVVCDNNNVQRADDIACLTGYEGGGAPSGVRGRGLDDRGAERRRRGPVRPAPALGGAAHVARRVRAAGGGRGAGAR